MIGMKKHKKILLAAVGLLTVMVLVSLGLTMSFLTDVEVADNIITIGNVNLKLDEGAFEDSKVIAAGGVLPKAPKIINTGSRDEFVFMRVAVPKKNVTLLYEHNEGTHKTGEKIDGYPKITEIFKVIADGSNKTDISDNDPPDVVFSYNKGSTSADGWVYLKKDTLTEGGKEFDTYYFGYNKRLISGSDAAKAESVTLFDKIQLKSFIDEQLKDATVDVGIKAYGIQADELNIDGLNDSFRGNLNDTQVGKVFEIVERKQVI